MGPEVLTLVQILGPVTLAGLALAAGWYARGRVAQAAEDLLALRVSLLQREVEDLKAQAARSQQAGSLALDAARRRADHDADSDPRGLGLLLPDGVTHVDFRSPPPGPTQRSEDPGDRASDSTSHPDA